MSSDNNTEAPTIPTVSHWRACVASVTTVVHRGGSLPHAVVLNFRVEDPAWDGRTLRWDGELKDPNYRRVADAAGCVAVPNDFISQNMPNNLIVGFPVTITVAYVAMANGDDRYDVVEVAPAPAERSPNGIHWVRVPREQPRLLPFGTREN